MLRIYDLEFLNLMYTSMTHCFSSTVSTISTAESTPQYCMLGIASRRITPCSTAQRSIALRSFTLGCRARSNNDNKKNCDLFPKSYPYKRSIFHLKKRLYGDRYTGGKST